MVSAFVVGSFAAYAVHDRLVNGNPTTSASAPANQESLTQLTTNKQSSVPTMLQAVPTSQQLASNAQPAVASAPTNAPVIPTNTPVPPTATTQQTGQYKDGVYTGPTVDAFYGLVQVQATVQSGKLADVQFLQFPNDRRTSQMINRQAMPWLVQEAIQAQSAYVNIISGATLTSEGFAQSLYAALNQAKNQL